MLRGSTLQSVEVHPWFLFRHGDGDGDGDGDGGETDIDGDSKSEIVLELCMIRERGEVSVTVTVTVTVIQDFFEKNKTLLNWTILETLFWNGSLKLR